MHKLSVHLSLMPDHYQRQGPGEESVIFIENMEEGNDSSDISAAPHHA